VHSPIIRHHLGSAVMSEWQFTVSNKFSVGYPVWPKINSPMIFQRAPQFVIAVSYHPEYGEWLWLDAGECRLGSWYAGHWTVAEPDDEYRRTLAEKRRRLTREIRELPVSAELPVILDNITGDAR
jgi:hypothetical protein